jgi:F-type H+-transporting ATPase subunit epsilon
MAELTINILSPSRVVLRQAASSITLPSVLGQLGILPGHTRLVSEISVGELRVGDDSSQRFFVSGGYIDIKDNNVNVLADVVERPDEISIDRARKALDRAKTRIEKPSADVDLTRALASMTRATQRLEIAK